MLSPAGKHLRAPVLLPMLASSARLLSHWSNPRLVASRYNNPPPPQTALFHQLFVESMHAIGPAPCTFAVMGLGSMSFGGMCLYSDLEFFVLTETNEHEEYWERVVRLCSVEDV